MNSFLKSVANYLYSHYENELHDIAIIFPNKRARLFFNEELAQIVNKPSFSPSYLTISELFERLSVYHQADDLTLLFNLYQSYCKVMKNPQPFDFFYPYCQTMLADFDDMEKYHLEAKSLFSNLSDLRSMEAYADYLTENQKEALKKFWLTFNSDASYEEKNDFLKFWDSLYAIYSDFTQSLKDQQLGFEGMIYRDVSANFSDYLAELKHTKYAFIGFNALNTSEQKVFNALQKHNKALFFWDYDNYYTTKPVSEYHEAGYFLKNYTHTYPSPNDFSFESNLTGKKKIEIVNIPTNTGQVGFLPDLLTRFDDITAANSKDFLIGLGDEELLQPLIYNLPESVGDINVTMGYPGKRTNTYQLFNSLINLYLNTKRNDKSIRMYHKDVIALLHNPLVKKLSPDTDTSELIQTITEQNLVYIQPVFFNNTAEIFQQLLQLKDSNLAIIQHFCFAFQLLIDNQTYTDDSLHIVERETLMHLHKRIHDFELIMQQNTIPMNLTSLLKLMRNYISEIQVPFSGEPLKGLQIMGILETRNLDFKNILLLSMNEGIFPKPSLIPSMIPYTLRKGFDLPTPEHQDAIFSYYFYRLLQRAENVVLVYSSKDDGLNKGEPSRFIQQLIYDSHFEVKESTLSYSIKPSAIRSIFGQNNEETKNALKEYYAGGSKRLSPSAINTWLNCRLQFYFRYIAQLKEKDEVSNEIEANVFGSILHKTMELLYSSNNKHFDKSRIETLRKNKIVLEKAVIKAFEEEYIRAANETEIAFEGNTLIVKEVIKQYIENILKYDAGIAPFNIRQLEERFSVSYTKPSLPQPIKLGGTIDRLDELNGQIRVVDYKTGNKKLDFSDVESLFTEKPSKRNGAAFQTLLYSFLVKQRYAEKAVVPTLYFTKELSNDKYSYLLQIGQARQKVALETYEEVAAEFEEMLEKCLTELFTSEDDFLQTEDTKYCEYCSYRDICNR